MKNPSKIILFFLHRHEFSEEPLREILVEISGRFSKCVHEMIPGSIPGGKPENIFGEILVEIKKNPDEIPGGSLEDIDGCISKTISKRISAETTG